MNGEAMVNNIKQTQKVVHGERATSTGNSRNVSKSLRFIVLRTFPRRLRERVGSERDGREKD